MSDDSAEKIKVLMRETIASGTSRRTFASLHKSKKFQIVDMGGKTGHLTGDDPKGGVDWFIGYAKSDDREIAIGTVTVNKKYWTVKSSFIGQTLFKKAFEDDVAVASNP
jgi:cell division protein FtsI/penicillin-binding protein 2